MDCGEDGTGAGTLDLGTALGGGAGGPPLPRVVLPPAGADGVCIPTGVFKKHIDTFVSYT